MWRSTKTYVRVNNLDFSRHLFKLTNHFEIFLSSSKLSFLFFRSVAVDKFNYKLLYSTLFGGVTAFRLSDFVGANGYPTVFWGWGGEDDDMYLRVVRKLKKSITRYPMEIARYKMIRTHDHTSGKANPHRHTILYSKYDYNLDGINTTNYTLHNIVFYKLFTLINVTLTEEPFDRIRARLHIKKKK
jgi:hypothetical protein